MKNTAAEIKLLHPQPPTRRDRPDFYLPSHESLDLLLDYEIHSLERLESFLDRKAADDLHYKLTCSWEWFDGFLDSLQWYIDLLDRSLESRLPQESCLEIDPQFASQRSEFLALMNDVMVAYMPAKQQTLPYSSQTSESSLDALLELLRRYWSFVRRVLAFAREVWPGFWLPESLNPVELEIERERAFWKVAA